ncbi:hypothetical protein BG74_06160 [Sodalis-like endosymbiont of Proechinophthirus fluctus]|nr:hypothetical protein BG74_06160 [Sodalis-like endosymbiont of Proechinophthirus fluctus]
MINSPDAHRLRVCGAIEIYHPISRQDLAGQALIYAGQHSALKRHFCWTKQSLALVGFTLASREPFAIFTQQRHHLTTIQGKMQGKAHLLEGFYPRKFHTDAL